MQSKFDVGQKVYYVSGWGRIIDSGIIREVSLAMTGKGVPELKYYIEGLSFDEESLTADLWTATTRAMTKENLRHQEQVNSIIERSNELLDQAQPVKAQPVNQSEAGCDCQDGPCNCELAEPTATCPCGEHGVRFY